MSFKELSQSIHDNKMILGTAISFALTSPDVSRIVSDKDKTIVFYKDKPSETFFKEKG